MTAISTLLDSKSSGPPDRRAGSIGHIVIPDRGLRWSAGSWAAGERYCTGDVGGDVEVVRRAHEAFNRAGPEAALPFLDPEVEWHDVPDQPEATVHHGHEGFLQAFRIFLEPFEEFTVTPKELRDLGDHVLMVGHTRGRGLDSGAEFIQDVASLWTLRAGKVVQTRFFRSRADALEAAGLSE